MHFVYNDYRAREKVLESFLDEQHDGLNIYIYITDISSNFV